jgi:hypothetical protein
MSQPELVAVLRATRPAAPPELRERVRMLAATAAEPRQRRLTWRRALVIAVAVAAAVAAAAFVAFPRGSGTQNAAPPPAPVERAAARGAFSNATAGAVPKGLAAPPLASSARAADLPAPTLSRPQRYSATLELRLRNAAAVSAASKRATAIVGALGGFPSALNVDAGGAEGYASLVFRVPRAKVGTAVRRLSALGTILNENVRIQDLGAQVSAADRVLQRLRKQLAMVRAEPYSTENHQRIAGLEAQIGRRQRARASTLRAAALATVTLQLESPAPRKAVVVQHARSPLHNLGVALRWLGIGALYALALGLPFVLVGVAVWLVTRGVRRRREDALLSRS